MLVAGPAGSGKSCVVGKLLCECGGADPKAVLQYEKAAQERLKRPAGSGLAWVTDTLPRERRGGHTLRCSWSRIAGGVSLIDTPGLATRLAEFHRGLAQAGAAMFVCSAAPEEFERSIFLSFVNEDWQRWRPGSVRLCAWWPKWTPKVCVLLNRGIGKWRNS